MEDGSEGYQRPYHESQPMVCLEEESAQELVAEARKAISLGPGQAQRPAEKLAIHPTPRQGSWLTMAANNSPKESLVGNVPGTTNRQEPTGDLRRPTPALN